MTRHLVAAKSSEPAWRSAAMLRWVTTRIGKGSKQMIHSSYCCGYLSAQASSPSEMKKDWLHRWLPFTSIRRCRRVSRPDEKNSAPEIHRADAPIYRSQLHRLQRSAQVEDRQASEQHRGRMKATPRDRRATRLATDVPQSFPPLGRSSIRSLHRQQEVTPRQPEAGLLEGAAEELAHGRPPALVALAQSLQSGGQEYHPR
jgi:hypothetical protein